MNNEEIKKYLTVASKGFVALIPFLGPMLVEVLNVTIPNQRQERLEKLLNIVSSRVLDLDLEKLEEKFNSPDFLDIFEDVLLQTVRATSDKRIEYLASVIEDGLKQEEIEHLEIKRLLEILQKINDVEVIILQSYEQKNNNQEFNEKHSKILNLLQFPPDLDLSALPPDYFDSLPSDKLRQHRAMLNNYKSNLISLGLIGPFGSFELKSRFQSNLYITTLGVMLLEKIGIKNGKEQLIGKQINSIDVSIAASDRLEQREKEIRQELEKESKKAQRDLENIIDKFTSQLRRRF